MFCSNCGSYAHNTAECVKFPRNAEAALEEQVEESYLEREQRQREDSIERAEHMIEEYGRGNVPLKNMLREQEQWKRLLGLRDGIHPNTKFGDNVRLGEGVVIDGGCEIGDNTFIGHYCVLRPYTKIGANCKIGHHCVFEGWIEIGDYVNVRSMCFIAEYTEIGPQTYIGPKTVTTAVRNIRHTRNIPLEFHGVKIGVGVRIGASVTILPGVCIHDNVLVGAGSVVTGDCVAKGVYIGAPARLTGDVPEEELL